MKKLFQLTLVIFLFKNISIAQNTTMLCLGYEYLASYPRSDNPHFENKLKSKFGLNIGIGHYTSKLFFINANIGIKSIDFYRISGGIGAGSEVNMNGFICPFRLMMGAQIPITDDLKISIAPWFSYIFLSKIKGKISYYGPPSNIPPDRSFNELTEELNRNDFGLEGSLSLNVEKFIVYIETYTGLKNLSNSGNTVQSLTLSLGIKYPLILKHATAKG